MVEESRSFKDRKFLAESGGFHRNLEGPGGTRNFLVVSRIFWRDLEHSGGTHKFLVLSGEAFNTLVICSFLVERKVNDLALEMQASS